MSDAHCQTETIAFLSDPKSFGPDTPAVERCETHGAIVFLAGNRAYKLKRAVRFPYMDYSTPTLRQAMCEKELAVNRRAAPLLYLAVRPIVRDSGGRLRFGNALEGERAVDWVVVMRRFPQAALFEEMRRRGELTLELMQKLAEVIAAFHGSAEHTSGFGGAAGIGRVIEENIAVLQSFVGKPFAQDKIGIYAKLVREFHARASPLLEQRREEGFVRRCHGDLHLNNICLIEGEPVLFDAIEFSEDFACIDVFYDLAFLLMDLEHHGLRPLGNVLLNRYLEKTADYGGLAALPLFLSCRAAVRAHVSAARAKLADAQANVRHDAEAFLQDAIAFLTVERPKLIVIGGLSGTGKSTIAREIAPATGNIPGAIILRSDVIRKRMYGAAETTRLPPEAYTPDVTARVYATLAEHAAGILMARHSVIADAVYGLPEERAAIAAVARRASVPFLPFWLHGPLGDLEQRISARHDDASDATVEVLHRQAQLIGPPPDWLQIDVSGTIGQSAGTVLAHL